MLKNKNWAYSHGCQLKHYFIQIPQLLNDKQFELAVMVANSSFTDADTQAQGYSEVIEHIYVVKIKIGIDLLWLQNLSKGYIL